MSLEFEARLLKLTSERRKILADAEALLAIERRKLDVERYFDIDNLYTPEIRSEASTTLSTYRKQLLVEKSFYAEFHSSFVADVMALTDELSESDRVKVLSRCIPGLEANNSLRMEINLEKGHAASKLENLINLLDRNRVSVKNSEAQIELHSESALIELQRLTSELDHHLENQHGLAMQQRKRGVDGQRFLERLFNLFKNA